MASKLAQNVASDVAVHSYMSFNTCYTDTGLWWVWLVVGVVACCADSCADRRNGLGTTCGICCDLIHNPARFKTGRLF